LSDSLNERTYRYVGKSRSECWAFRLTKVSQRGTVQMSGVVRQKRLFRNPRLVSKHSFSRMKVRTFTSSLNLRSRSKLPQFTPDLAHSAISRCVICPIIYVAQSRISDPRYPTKRTPKPHLIHGQINRTTTSIAHNKVLRRLKVV
jgi:hypothetical protein